MKKFKFRLEKILQYREIIKTEKKRELSLRLGVLREAEVKLESLFSAQAVNNMPQDAVCSADEFFMRGQYSTRLKEEIVKQRLVIIEAEKKVEEARLAYIEAAKETKTLDMLKDKKKEQYEELVRHEESKILDETVTQRSNVRQ
jgi:flagellar FliJ protein